MGSAVGVDLFAFMNIMAATIGVQVLLILIIALQLRPGGQSVQFVPSGSAGNLEGTVLAALNSTSALPPRSRARSWAPFSIASPRPPRPNSW